MINCKENIIQSISIPPISLENGKKMFPSKYDDFWRGKIEMITPLIEEAVNHCESNPIDVSNLGYIGDANDYYGSVFISNSGIVGNPRNTRPHLKSLARILRENNLLVQYSNHIFKISISGTRINKTHHLIIHLMR